MNAQAQQEAATQPEPGEPVVDYPEPGVEHIRSPYNDLQPDYPPEI
jgi:hypothetical protein